MGAFQPPLILLDRTCPAVFDTVHTVITYLFLSSNSTSSSSYFCHRKATFSLYLSCYITSILLFLILDVLKFDLSCKTCPERTYAAGIGVIGTHFFDDESARPSAPFQKWFCEGSWTTWLLSCLCSSRLENCVRALTRHSSGLGCRTRARFWIDDQSKWHLCSDFPDPARPGVRENLVSKMIARKALFHTRREWHH